MAVPFALYVVPTVVSSWTQLGRMARSAGAERVVEVGMSEEELASSVAEAAADGLQAVAVSTSGESVPPDLFDVLLPCRDGECRCLNGLRFEDPASAHGSMRALCSTYCRLPGCRRCAEGDDSEETVHAMYGRTLWAMGAGTLLGVLRTAFSSGMSARDLFRSPVRMSLALRAAGVSLVVANPPRSWCRMGDSMNPVRYWRTFTGEMSELTHAQWGAGPDSTTNAHASVPASAGSAPSSEDPPRVGGAARDPFIVSLTSIPDRIANTHLVVKSLLDQELPAEKIVLYLSDRQFPGGVRDLPRSILDMEGDRFEIRFDDGDIRSYKKLIPVMRPSQFPGMDVVVVDDDYIYRGDMTRLMSDAHMSSRDCIVGNCGSVVTVREGVVAHARGSIFERVRSMYLKACTGCMYIPRDVDLGGRFCRRDLFMSICPTHDELWLWACSFASGTAQMCTGLCRGWDDLMVLRGIEYRNRLNLVNPKVIPHIHAALTNYMSFTGGLVDYPGDPLHEVATSPATRTW